MPDPIATTVNVIYDREKECKNTVRFKARSDTAPVTQLYIKRRDLPLEAKTVELRFDFRA